MPAVWGFQGRSCCFYTCQTVHCSPHSREVVKTVFSRSFGVVNLKKGVHDGKPGRFRQSRAPKERGHTSLARPVWAALCGRFGDADAMALAVLRGPIRRRPYNRGEIITRSRAETIFINDFCCALLRRPRRGGLACRGQAAEQSVHRRRWAVYAVDDETIVTVAGPDGWGGPGWLYWRPLLLFLER